MTVWLRSLFVLVASFAGVAGAAFALAVVIVPDRVGSTEAPGSAPPAAPTDPQTGDLDAVPTAIGGTLIVTGDREMALALDRESTDGQYGLIGNDARVFVAGDPPSIVQMNLDGLSFFPDSNACTITLGRLNQAIGVASAQLRCEDLADVRESGVVTVDGVVGMAADTLGMRGDLPSSGGTVALGDETLEFADAVLFAMPATVVGGRDDASMRLVDGRFSLSFGYDAQTHGVSLAFIGVDDGSTEIGPESCSIATRELGRLNPRITVLDLTLTCPAVDLPDLGTVAIDGSLIVEQVEVTY